MAKNGEELTNGLMSENKRLSQELQLANSSASQLRQEVQQLNKETQALTDVKKQYQLLVDEKNEESQTLKQQHAAMKA